MAELNFGNRALAFWRSRLRCQSYLWDSHHDLNECFLAKYIRQTDTVLDLGCGDGELTRRIAKRAKRVVAVDFVKAHSELPPNVESVVADVCNWEPQESFNLIIGFGLSQFIDNDEELVRVYQMCRRCLRAGGTLLLKHQAARGHDDKIVDGYSESLCAHYASIYRTIPHDIALLSSGGFSPSVLSPYPSVMNHWPDTYYKAYRCRKEPRIDVLSQLTDYERVQMPKLWDNTYRHVWQGYELDIASSLALLRAVSEGFRGQGVPVFLAFGTLLGVIRDKALISYDVDVDLVVREQDSDAVYPALASCGYPFLRVQPHLFTVGSPTAYLDVFVYLEEYGSEYEYEKKKYNIAREDLDNPETVEFEGHTYLVPRRPEYYLQRWYGQWRKPQNYWRSC